MGDGNKGEYVDMSPVFSMAYSSDSDDALMIWALKRGLSDVFLRDKSSQESCIQDNASDVFRSPFSYAAHRCVYLARDIEKLNQQSLYGTYEVSALSAAVFPQVKERYQLLSVGMSFAGRDLGPTIVTLKDSAVIKPADLRGKVVALPGSHTSAYATARMCIGDFEPYFCSFSQIASRVLSGKCSAGILIHEEQLQLSSDRLRVVGHLGDLWHNLSGCEYLPLGVIGIRRSLCEHTKHWLLACYRFSIQYGLQNCQEILPDILALQNVKLPMEKARAYIHQYVGSSALSLTPEHIDSLQCWYREGRKIGLWEASFHIQEDMV
ncbi:MAG: hypothetical protein OXC44_06800 [Proteobacteria bacterium]|nr:hypothetical protein [Pseudomonadota bacterium]